ncbi:MAG TPA: glycosyltransferase [Polyangia bacterium]|jgi:phenylacetate-CoA ligase|nr:glycosyltransferase [Polyangia bacterium]
MQPELSVVVPCFNEEFNVDELSRRVLGVFEVGGFSGELILVDDGSADGTRAAIEALAARFPGQVVGQFHAKNAGIAAAWRTGTAAATGRLVAIIDADLQYQPEDLLRMRRELIEHSLDIVQGWRSTVGRKKETRYYMSRGLNALLNKTFGMSLKDNKSGFVVCAKEVMEDLLTYTGSYHYWQSFIMVAAHAKGYSYKEVEILFENRRQGVSFLEKTAYRAVARSFADLPKAAWEYRLTRTARDIGEQFVRRHPVLDRSTPRAPARDLHWKAYMATFERTHWMLTRDVERYYDTLRKTQWLAPSEMRDLQDEKLRRLVRHAYRNVPYYRSRMQDLKLRPEDIRGQADLHKLPFLTKADVRKHLYFDILSENHSKRDVLKVTTSGSTGEPFVVFADRAQLEFRWAATLRSQEWTGYEFGDRCVRLWHQTLGMDKAQVAKERLDAAFNRRKFIPVFEMSEDKLDAMAREIAAWNPVLMDGYAEALDFLAHYLKSRSDLPVRPKALMSSAQTLPDQSRKLIEEAFGCRVFDKYGAREFSGIAYECASHTGHHVVAEGFIVEILRDGQPVEPGEMGEIVITDLNNYCLPFVRYRLGDLGVAVDPAFACPCGRGLPLIGNIEGRVQSIIQGTHRRFLPGSFFPHYLKEFDHAIQKFQVVQEREGAITFNVVKGGRFSDDVLQEVLATFRQHLGADMQIDVSFVDNIEMVRTGKRLASVSRLKVDFQKNAPEQVSGVRSRTH